METEAQRKVSAKDRVRVHTQISKGRPFAHSTCWPSRGKGVCSGALSQHRGRKFLVFGERLFLETFQPQS